MGVAAMSRRELSLPPYIPPHVSPISPGSPLDLPYISPISPLSRRELILMCSAQRAEVHGRYRGDMGEI